MAYILARNRINHIIRRRPEQLRDDGELVDVVLAGEQRLALEHLGKDAPGAPDVHLDVVLLPREHDLGGPVVPRRHVARHLRVLDARQPKVADLEVAVLVDQDVTRFEVAVDDAGGVDVFETALGDLILAKGIGQSGEEGGETNHDLVEEILNELLLEWPRREKPVEIGPQQFCDKVSATGQHSRQMNYQRPRTYISSSGEIKMSLSEMTCTNPSAQPTLSFSRIVNSARAATHILVLQVLEQLQLAICPLGEHGGAEGLHDLLDGDGLVRELVLRGARRERPCQSRLLSIFSERVIVNLPDQTKRSHADGLEIRVPVCKKAAGSALDHSCRSDVSRARVRGVGIPRCYLKGGPKDLGAHEFGHGGQRAEGGCLWWFRKLGRGARSRLCALRVAGEKARGRVGDAGQQRGRLGLGEVRAEAKQRQRRVKGCLCCWGKQTTPSWR